MASHCPCQHQPFCEPVISGSACYVAEWGSAQGAGGCGDPRAAGQGLADRAHPTPAGQRGYARPSSWHWAPPWEGGRLRPGWNVSRWVVAAQQGPWPGPWLWTSRCCSCIRSHMRASGGSGSPGHGVSPGHGHLMASESLSQSHSAEEAVLSATFELSSSPGIQRPHCLWGKGGLLVHPGFVLQQIIMLYFHFPSS